MKILYFIINFWYILNLDSVKAQTMNPKHRTITLNLPAASASAASAASGGTSPTTT